MHRNVFALLAKTKDEKENKNQGEEFSHFTNEFSREIYASGVIFL